MDPVNFQRRKTYLMLGPPLVLEALMLARPIRISNVVLLIIRLNLIKASAFHVEQLSLIMSLSLSSATVAR